MFLAQPGSGGVPSSTVSGSRTETRHYRAPGVSERLVGEGDVCGSGSADHMYLAAIGQEFRRPSQTHEVDHAHGVPICAGTEDADYVTPLRTRKHDVLTNDIKRCTDRATDAALRIAF